jgi:uncharacterized membrane protein
VGPLHSATVLGTSVYLISWVFLIYSFLGVLIEGIFCLAVEGVLELRLGLLYLPLRPIYGAGGAGCTLFLHRFSANPPLVFLFGMLICSVVEYIASFATEKGFGTVSWDYSDKVANLQGRICLQYSLGWGVLALLAVYVLDPFLIRLVNATESHLAEEVLTVLMLLAVASGILTLAALARARRRVDTFQARVEGRPVPEYDTWSDRLIDRLAPDSVMINSFPRMSLMTELVKRNGEHRMAIGLSGRPASISK